MGVIRKEYPAITGRLGFRKQRSQAIKKVLPILVVLKYPSMLYPPDHNVMKNTGSLPEADKRKVGLIVAWPNFYYFTYLLSI